MLNQKLCLSFWPGHSGSSKGVFDGRDLGGSWSTNDFEQPLEQVVLLFGECSSQAYETNQVEPQWVLGFAHFGLDLEEEHQAIGLVIPYEPSRSLSSRQPAMRM